MASGYLSIYGSHSNGWDVNNTVRWSHRCPWKAIALVSKSFPSLLGLWSFHSQIFLSGLIQYSESPPVFPTKFVWNLKSLSKSSPLSGWWLTRRLFQLAKTDWVPQGASLTCYLLILMVLDLLREGLFYGKRVHRVNVGGVAGRNARIFEDKVRNSEYLWDSIRFLASLWAFCSKVFKGIPLNVFQLDWKEGNMEIVYPHSEDPNTSERDELLPFMDAKNYLLHEPEQPGLEPGGRGVSLDTQLTFTQVSVHWQDTDSMREELDDLQVCKSDFLSTRWAILLNLHVEMFRVNKYPVYSVEDILQVLIVFAVESLELDFALLFPERHILLRVLPVLVVLATSSEKDSESLYKRVKINRLINIFKNDPVIPAFPDLHLSPAAILKELAMYFQKFSTQTRLLTLPSPHELPPREAQEYPFIFSVLIIFL
ncbi:Protein PIR [Vitis vinifera]|uniref:Protein PIR n=1 Tax=Vitis vinifera TaxID=29760 RepID=A0A438JQT6_VITVI|nr:Protein PIR [Vitis vinifera]